MRETIGHSIAATLDGLRRQAHERLVWPSPEAAFAAEFLDHHLESMTSDGGQPARNRRERGEAPALAVEGYRIFAHYDQLDKSELGSWQQGVVRLSQRDAFAADRQTFAYRPFELVGIALGIARTGVQRDWFDDVLERLSRDRLLNTRQRVLLALIREQYNLPISQAVMVEPNGSPLGDLALTVVLAARHNGLIRFNDTDGERGARHILLRRCLLEPPDQLDGIESVALWHGAAEIATEYLDLKLKEAGSLGPRTATAVADVMALCERFDIVARQLTRRHNGRAGIQIGDEYDVQDILHALLLSRFKDVRPEEWTPSYAGTSARTDFLLKQEQVFVEAKKTRKALRDREVVEQLTIDVAYYRHHPECRALVCCVYDPDRLVQNPTAIQNDLSGERDGLIVRIVVCPSG